MIDLKDFDWKYKIRKKRYKHIDIYYVGYITIKEFDEYNKINSVKSFVLNDSFCYSIF